MGLKYINSVGEVFNFANVKNIIILSPSFYWYVEKSVQIKSLRKVKKLAPSILVGRAESMNEFFVIANGENHYKFYAYCKECVEKIITESEFDECEIYFANQLNFSEDIKITDEYSIKNIDGAMIEIASSLEAKNLEVIVNENEFNSKPFKIKSLKSQNSDLYYNTLLGLFAILVVSSLTLSFMKVSALSSKIDSISYGDRNSYSAASLMRKYKKLESKKEKIKKDFLKITKSSGVVNEISYDGVSFVTK
ncbi:MAG: hypothetical protein GQ570_01950 [Helicobacteraceae bacterium]|nr:hypothetical protein [Helicobacteraceae bacterium]